MVTDPQAVPGFSSHWSMKVWRGHSACFQQSCRRYPLSCQRRVDEGCVLGTLTSHRPVQSSITDAWLRRCGVSALTCHSSNQVPPGRSVSQSVSHQSVSYTIDCSDHLLKLVTSDERIQPVGLSRYQLVKAHFVRPSVQLLFGSVSIGG